MMVGEAHQSIVPPAVAAFVRRLEEQHAAGTLKWPEQTSSPVYSYIYRLRQGHPVLPRHFTELAEWARGVGLESLTGPAVQAVEQHEAWYRATAADKGRRREARLTPAQRAAHRDKRLARRSVILEALRLWGTLGRCYRDIGFKTTLTNIGPQTRETKLAQILDAFNRKRKEQGDEALTLDGFKVDYCGLPKAQAQTCPLCDTREMRDPKRHRQLCAALHRIFKHTLPHPGNKMLVALVADAAQIPRDVTAKRLHVPSAAVTEWTTPRPRMRLVKNLRRLLRRMSPLRALASVLRISVSAAREYVYGRGYRRLRLVPGKRHSGPITAKRPPKFMWRHTHLLMLLDMKPSDFCLAFGLKGMYADELEQRGRSGLMARARWGRRRSTCAIVQAAVHLLLRGKTPNDAADWFAGPETDPGVYVPPRLLQAVRHRGGRSFDTKELLRSIRDEWSCSNCRPYVVLFLSEYDRMTERAIADRWDVALGSVSALIRRGRRLVGVIASGLSTGQVAARLRKSPSTVRRWADADRIPFVRTRGGRRRFTVRHVQKTASSVHAN